jgi:23S rRNA pseudouridine1911/1915/1917 synthase
MTSQDVSLTVPPETAGHRLDKWLAEAMTAISRSRLKALIEDGAVSVNGKTETDPAARTKAGQSIILRIPPAEDATPTPQSMDLVVVYEDNDLIIIDKPAGLVVHPAPGNLDNTLVNALLAHCGDSLRGIGGVRRPGIVHRIDKDTSGLLVVAKTEPAHTGLSAQFAAHDIERLYDAFVWGLPNPKFGFVRGAIGRSRHNRKKMALVPGGKFAETHFETVDTFGKTSAHIQCRLKTGRTHQIRVHMTSIGHPLIGDRTYGGPRSILGLPIETGKLLKHFPRQALHARTLGFTHPISGEALRFESELPEDLLELQDALNGI